VYHAAVASTNNPVRGLEVLDTEGERVPVEKLWQDAPAVIGFVRHFG
jgi:hypothetical protein